MRRMGALLQHAGAAEALSHQEAQLVQLDGGFAPLFYVLI